MEGSWGTEPLEAVATRLVKADAIIAEFARRLASAREAQMTEANISTSGLLYGWVKDYVETYQLGDMP